MIATIQAPNKNGILKAAFEAMKMGIECEVYENNCMDITVHTQNTADRLASYASGKIIAVQDKMDIGPYFPVEELMQHLPPWRDLAGAQITITIYYDYDYDLLKNTLENVSPM